MIIDSGFCVLRGLIGMFKRGVCGSIFVNKIRYYPQGIYINVNNANFDPKYIDDNDFLSGNFKGVDFDLFIVKYSD